MADETQAGPPSEERLAELLDRLQTSLDTSEKNDTNGPELVAGWARLASTFVNQATSSWRYLVEFGSPDKTGGVIQRQARWKAKPDEGVDEYRQRIAISDANGVEAIAFPSPLKSGGVVDLAATSDEVRAAGSEAERRDAFIHSLEAGSSQIDLEQVSWRVISHPEFQSADSALDLREFSSRPRVIVEVRILVPENQQPGRYEATIIDPATNRRQARVVVDLIDR